MSLQNRVRRYLWKFGYDIVRFKPNIHPLARRKQLLREYDIDTVLDVGANIGFYGLLLRQDMGYKGRIISFEPLSTAFSVLTSYTDEDSRWEAHNYALGNVDEESVINVSGNSYSSSLLKMLPTHSQVAPQSKYVGQEKIHVFALDTIYPKLNITGRNIYLKIDTQGYEERVLEGAKKSLALIDTVQMEMSLVPLYESESLLCSIIEKMSKLGYTLVSLEPGFSNPKSGQLLQVDGIFHKL